MAIEIVCSCGATVSAIRGSGKWTLRYGELGQVKCDEVRQARKKGEKAVDFDECPTLDRFVAEELNRHRRR